jgi:hypothetical protein
MYDLWYAVGTSIMFPDFLAGIKANAAACFTNVPQRITPTNLSQDLPGRTYNIPGGGYVNETIAPTLNDVRNAIAAGVQAKFNATGNLTPAISQHAAATLSQWISVPVFDYVALATATSGAFASVAGGGDYRRFSPCFPALIGVLFVDYMLPTHFVNNTAAAQNLMDEFHIPSPPNAERQTLTNFASSDHFKGLVTQNSIANWQQCPHGIVPWPGHNSGMLN